MGTTNSSYIGIYLTIPAKVKKVQKTSYYNSRGVQTNAQFCSETGKPNKKFEQTVDELTYPSSQLSEYDTITPEETKRFSDDNFMVPAYHDYSDGSTMIINHRCKYAIEDEEYQVNVDISKIDVQKLIEEFKSEFKYFLEILEREYGVVNVHFGLVAYAG